jgi:4-alpha-glucanotransferase
LEELFAQGFLTADELHSCKASPTGDHAVDYPWIEQSRIPALQAAYKRMGAEMQRELASLRRELKWLDGYADFMARKMIIGTDIPWNEWDRGKEPSGSLRGEWEYWQGFWRFTQLLFFRQWDALRAYANGRGVRIIGDLPIYCHYDSAEVYARPELFQLDENFAMTQVAGVPPDYFSAEGQLWGNVLYDWDRMKLDGYQWWMDRIALGMRLFDSIRIDHFRAFYDYWAVPFGRTTAQEGKWMPGPGMEIVRRVWQTFDKERILVEDLGDLSVSCRAFIDRTGFPGMRVLQFAFLGGDNVHLPHRYIENSIAYTGTHDNNTTLGWIWEMPEDERARALNYCGFVDSDWGTGGPRSKALRAVFRTLWQSVAKLAIVPVQDLCGFGSDTRINIPGTPEGNWRFRVTAGDLAGIDRRWWAELNRTYGRAGSLAESRDIP